jgi:hypothetical protein
LQLATVGDHHQAEAVLGRTILPALEPDPQKGSTKLIELALHLFKGPEMMAQWHERTGRKEWWKAAMDHGATDEEYVRRLWF